MNGLVNYIKEMILSLAVCRHPTKTQAEMWNVVKRFFVYASAPVRPNDPQTPDTEHKKLHIEPTLSVKNIPIKFSSSLAGLSLH